ncbi:MAG: hypothetical protein Q9219_005319 [cf. Caloplaca sp. 3 TL-2023]
MSAPQSLSLSHTNPEVLPLPSGTTEVEPTISPQFTQDSIDPAFRLPVANDQSPGQQLRHQQQQAQGEASSPAEATEPLGKARKKAAGGPRLKKACDSCSKRKIKCDEAGPPCRRCKEVLIPCTYTRPSRRRGPRNRHADAIKEQLGIGETLSEQASPTYAAQTLASLAQQPILSTDSICPTVLLERFVDDYFTYIHPLVPFPHEPTFRAALAARDDMYNPTFVALLASMVGCLVTSFPRRPRVHIQDLRMEALIPNSGVLLERCRRTAVEARGMAHLDRQQTIDDAMIAYLQGLTGAYSFNWDACRLYLGQCLTISRVIGAYRQDGPGSAPPDKRDGDEGPASRQAEDLVLQESSRRLFWTLHGTIIAFQQLGLPSRELSMPPPTGSEPYPDLPVEIDDAYILPQGLRPVPREEVSALAGFNAIMKVYKVCIDVCAMEMAYGINELFDWTRQRRILRESINAAREVLSKESLSSKATGHPRHNYPPPTQGYPNPNRDQIPVQTESERKTIQTEIQKANLVAAEIATRSYLIGKYSILSDKVHELSEGGPDGADDEMGEDRDLMIKDFTRMIRDLDLTYLEANGLGFTNKLRQVVSSLVNLPPHRKSAFHRRVEPHLLRLVDFLSELQRAGPRGMGEGVDEEEVRTRQWAEMLEGMGD